MEDMSQSKGREDVDRQFKIIREDITTLSKLLREIGEEKAGEKRDAALAEAAELLEKSRSAIDEGRLKASAAKTSVEDYILSLIHISEPTRPAPLSRMPSSA